jgi:hypothetical protein
VQPLADYYKGEEIREVYMGRARDKNLKKVETYVQDFGGKTCRK